MPISRFALISLAGALLIGGIAYFMTPVVFTEAALSFVLFGIALAALSTIASYAMVSRGLKGRVQAFMQYIMGGMMVKMFLGITAVLVVAWKFEEIVAQYVLSYFFCYFIFLGFEVVTLMGNLRAENQDKRPK